MKIFPEYIRLQIKDEQTALNSPKCSITFELDDLALSLLQQKIWHTQDLLDPEKVLRILSLVNAERKCFSKPYNTSKAPDQLSLLNNSNEIEAQL